MGHQTILLKKIVYIPHSEEKVKIKLSQAIQAINEGSKKYLIIAPENTKHRRMLNVD